MVLKTVLVALDSSPLTEQVVGALEQLQLQPTTQVILAHVINSVTSDFERVADRPSTISEDIPYRHIEKQLEAYQGQLSCPTQLEIVTGEPAEEIIRLANIHKAELIVIGSRGLTGLNRILQGSVSSQVVSEAPCSVFVVKP